MPTEAVRTSRPRPAGPLTRLAVGVLLGRGAGAATLLRAAHPVPALAVTLFAAALAADAGQSVTGCLLVTLAVLSGQLSIGWSNDLVDRQRDVVAQRRDKPLATGALAPTTVALAAGCATAACVPLSLACGPAAGAAHLTGVAAGLAYNAVLKRTRWSWLPYALAFGLLPAFVTLGLPGRPWPPLWLPVAAALLGIGAHLTNVLPDIDADLAAGVRGLPHRLGPARSRALAALTLFTASLVLVTGPSGPAGATGWTGLALTACFAVAAALPRIQPSGSRLPFLLTIALTATDLALLLLRDAALR